MRSPPAAKDRTAPRAPPSRIRFLLARRLAFRQGAYGQTPFTEQSARLDRPHSGTDHLSLRRMWPGKQPPEGGQEPQQPAGQPSNPHLQPGYHQPNPFQQPQASNAPPQQAGMPVPPPPSGGRSRSTIVAVIAATAVVAAATATGFVLLGSGEDDRAGTNPTKTTSPQASPNNPRAGNTETATIKGWKVVVNPSQGIAFDVPPQWARQSPGWVTYVAENDDPDDTPLIGMRAPAYLKEQWCTSDEDKDGTMENTPLAVAGSRGNNGARSTEEIAGSTPRPGCTGNSPSPTRPR